MEFKLNNETFNVVFTKKAIKHIYLKVDKELNIVISAPRKLSGLEINGLLNENKETISKMILKIKRKVVPNSEVWYLGNKYNKIYVNYLKKTEISGNNVLTLDDKQLNSWLEKETVRIFSDRLNMCYNVFGHEIDYPKLKLRQMKTRWGVCNTRNHSITLNKELITMDLKVIDYVIYHELSHFIHFNHSKSFWALVQQYVPDYKKIRKQLKGDV